MSTEEQFCNHNSSDVQQILNRIEHVETDFVSFRCQKHHIPVMKILVSKMMWCQLSQLF